MCSLLHYFAVFKHNYLIKVKQGKNPMGDDYCCFVFEEPVQIGQNFFFSFCINGTEAIVKQNELRTTDQRPGDRDPLLLTATQGHSPFPYHGVVLLTETHDLLINIGI